MNHATMSPKISQTWDGSNFANSNSLPVSTLKERLLLQKRVQWIVGLLRIKLIELYQINDTILPDSKTTMFDSQEDGNYVFRVGSHFKFSLPADFILQTENTTNETLDFLIQDWSFVLNWQEIPLSSWVKSTVIDTLIKDSAARVVDSIDMAWKSPEEIELINEERTKKIEWIRWSFNRLVKKLLPERPDSGNPIIQKLPGIWKRPVFRIIPRA